MNQPSLSSPPLPSGKHLHKATSKPIAVPLARIGVAIVDDEEYIQLLLRGHLDRSQEFQCVGSYSSGEAALTGIPHSGAQVVFMDIKMPGMSGIESARRLKALNPHLVIVMITGLDDPRTIDLARECGADRFLPKPFTAAHLLATLTFCIPRPKVEIAKPQPSGKAAGYRGLRGRPLTARENELMQLLSEGLQYKEIADKWDVSVSAVHGMQHRVFQKLGVMNAREAIRKWLKIPGDSGDALR